MNNYHVSVDKTKLQDWLKAHESKDGYYWKENWWTNNMFIRDYILPLFSDSYEVVGSHYSKSIECPVIKTVYKGVEIIWQYNFYDWQIMIKSEKSLVLENLVIFDADGTYLYYQGIPEEYCFKAYSQENNKHFAIDISWDQPIRIWPFALELRRVIDATYENEGVKQ